MAQDGTGGEFGRVAGRLRSPAGRWMASGVASSISRMGFSKSAAVAAARNQIPCAHTLPGCNLFSCVAITAFPGVQYQAAQ